MQQPNAFQPGVLDVFCPETAAGSTLASERTLPRRTDHDRDRAGRLTTNRPCDLHARSPQLIDQPPSGLVVAHASDEAGRLPQAGCPGAEVGSLPTAAELDARIAVVVRDEVVLRGNGYIEQELADGGDQLF